MPRPTPIADARLPSGPFPVAAARASGIDSGHLRTAAFEAPFTGVRVPAGWADDLRERCRALATVLDEGVAFSHGTALRLLGVEVPWTLEDDDRIHVVTSRPQDRPQREREAVVAHRSRQARLDTIEVGGLLVTTPAQTFVHVAVGLRRPDDVVVLGDALMRRQHCLVSRAELQHVADRTHKVKGIAQVREQVEQMRPGTDSSTETRTRLALIAANLPCPEVNGVVRAPDGSYVKRVDMLYRRRRVAIEYDGDQHRTDREQWRDDVRRRRMLEALGWVVIVVVADDLRDPRALVARVRAALRPAARTLWA